MSEYGFPWFEIIGLAVSLLVPGAGALSAVWWRLQNQITSQDKALAEYKLQAAKEYAPNSAVRDVEQRIRETEQRLVDAINRLGDRVENYLDSNRNR